MGTAFLAVVFLVMSVSRAAFTATTANAANEVSTGTISLTDNDGGTAMFDSIANLAAYDSVTRCITVSYVGSIDPVPVRLYAAGVPTGALAPYLDYTVEIGPATADPFGSCASFVPSSALYTGTLDAFAATHHDFATGVEAWDPAGLESRTFRFTVTVRNDPLAAGRSAGWGTTWETRSS